MSENSCAFCRIATGEEESEIVHGEEGVDFHGVGGASLARGLVVPEDHVASPEEIGVLPEGRVTNMDTAESGYTIRTNNGSDAGQGIFLHPLTHVMGDRK
jgi:hypothetical protein